MSYYLDTKYINMLSSRLERFSWKRNNEAVCRCPICGDSQKNKSKTRFYFFQHKGKYFVKCHNCGYSNVFEKFLEHMAINLYDDYKLEKLRDDTGITAPTREVVIYKKVEFSAEVSPIENLHSIWELDESHPARKYLVGRKIPEQFLRQLYYTDNFLEVAQKLSKDAKAPKDHRIVIPYLNFDGKIFAIQGRALDSGAQLRYITIRKEGDDTIKAFGLNRINPKATNYCVEGPFDSMFLDNCFAMGGSGIGDIPFDTSNTVFVYDNEPRNYEIVKIIENVVDEGVKVCIWPDNVHEKDINDMVLAGRNPKEIIDKNTYQGLMAKLKFNQWRKV